MLCKPSPYVLLSWSLLCLLPGAAIAALLWVVLHRYLPAAAIPALLLWLAGLFLLVAVYLPQRRRQMTFSLTAEALTVHSGVLVTVRRRMPLTAVRHVTLLQGPLERLCGTVFLSVSGVGGHILIEGLDRHQADGWCRRLLPRE